MFEQLIGGSRRSSRGAAPSAVPARSGIRALEARFVFDAAAAATVAQSRVDAGGQAEHHGEQAAPADQAHTANAERTDIAPAAGPHETASTPGRHEVVVIDRSVPDLDTLLAGVPASAEVILIDSTRDGLDQLANALRGRTDIDAIHILSHGSEGDLRLGTSDLTAASIQGRYAADLAAIGAALSPDGDLLIYGCDFGGGAAGAHAVDLLAQATGADIAASDDATGDSALGGDWDLEVHEGQIETGVVIGEQTQRDWHHLLDATANNGRGALLAVSGRTIYSVDITTGKASAITTAPASVGGIALSGTLNSLAVDQANGLIYYVDSTVGANNKALFAYDFINDQHILIDSDLTDNGAGASITTGNSGVGGAGAAFSNGHLYLAVENVSGTTDQIYNLTFSNNGRTVATAANFGDQSNHNYDWGDLGIDQANGQLISLTRASYARFDLNTGAEVSYDASVTRTDVQAGVDQGGYIYTLGTNITRLNPTDGSAIGSGRAITTDGTNAPATAISDAASWTPPTSTISGTVFADKDANGSLTSSEPGVRNITVDLVDDVNNNGVADSGERVLATASTDSNGTYRFTGVLPGNFVVRVTDTEGRLSTASATTPTSGSVNDSRVGATLTGPNFGYNPTLVLDLDDAAAGTGHATSYTENGAPVAIAANDVAIADSLYTSLNSAKAVIENGSAGDTLGINGTLPAGITASYDGATYTLTLSGSGTVADYQTALSQITYTSTSEDPSAATRSVAVTVMDVSIPSNTARSAITVTPVDNAPALDLSSGSAGTGYAATYTEGGAGVAIVGSDVTVTDADNTTLASAHAVIGNGAAGDVLSVAGTLPAGISASYDPATYTLTLTGTASKADYQTALTQIRYASTSRDPDAGTRSIGFSVNDGSLDSNVATASIAVTAVDDAPDQGLPAGQSLAEDTSLVFSAARGNAITISDVDARGGNLTTTLGVAHGTLTLGSSAGVTVTGDGTGSLSLAGTASAIQTALDGLTYRPAANYDGTDTLSVSTNDNGNTGTGGPKTTTGAIALTVTPVDNAPALDLSSGSAGTGYAAAYTEGGVGVAVVGSDVTVTDADNATLASAHAVIGNGAAGDVLSVAGTLPAGISASYDPATYTLTLTGTASKADYQTALTQIRYASTSRDPDAGTRSIGFSVNDGSLDSNVATASIAVTAVDDAPDQGLPAGQSLAEDTSLVFSAARGNAITISDVDARGGNLTTTLGVAHGTLTLGSSAGVTVTGDGTGSLSLAGTASAIQTALDGLTYRPAANYDGTDTLSVSTNDNGNTGTGGPKTTTGAIALTVTPVNNAPALDLSSGSAGTGYAATYTEGGAGVAIVGSDVTVTDADNTTLASAHAVIGNGAAGDVLSVAGTLPAGISASYDPATYTLTLTGTASKADYQTALTQIRYASTSRDPDAGTRSIGFSVNDGSLDSNVATASIAVTAVDDAPDQGLPAGQSLAEDTSLVFSAARGNAITISDVDARGGNLTTTLGVAHGTLTLGSSAGVTVTGDGTGSLSLAGTASAIQTALDGLTYRPAANYDGTDTLSVSTNDNGNTGTGGPKTTTGAIALTVTPVDNAPALDLSSGSAGTGYAATYTEGGAGVAIVGSDVTVTDADNTTLASAHAVIGNGAAGDVLSVAGTLPAGISASYDPATYTLTLTGTASKADYQTALTQIRYASTSRDPDAGTRSIGFSVNDGSLDSNVATASIAVTAVDDAPDQGLPAGQSLAEDTSLVFSAARGNAITISDVDARGGNLTTTLGVAHGTLTLGSSAGVTVTGDGTGSLSLAGTASAIQTALDGLTYRPAANYDGTDTLSVSTNDNGNTGTGGPKTTTGAIALTVTPVNNAPALDLSSGSAGTGYAATYTEGGAGVAIVGSDVTVTDADNTTLASAHAVIGNGAAGDVLSVAGTLPAGISASYDPATYTLTLTGTASKADYQTALTQIRYASTSRDPDAGTRSIGFSVNDGSLDSNVATASIAVTAVDDAPDQGLPAGQSLAEDTSLVFSAARGNAITISDVDARGGNLTTTLGVAHGTLTLGSSAGVTVTGDGTGSLSLAGTASAIQTALDGLTYRPAANYDGTDTLSVSTNDNGNTGTGGPKTTTGAIALTVTPVDNAPVFDDRAGVFAPRAAIDQQEVAIPAGDAFRVASPGKSMAFSALGLPRGLIIDPGTGRISGMFARDASTATPGGLYSITVIARESDGASTSRVLSILVSNPPPIVSDTAAKLAQDTTYAGSLIGNARDPDGDVLHVDPLPVAAPAHGRLDLHPDGTFTYRPDAGFHGADAFSYAVVDADGGRTTATVRFTVDAAPDSSANTPPVAGADPVHTREQVPVEGRVTGHDADGDALSFSVATPPTSGRLVLHPDGGFTYTPAAGFRGGDSFIVRVSDNRGGAVFVTVPVSVEAVNHAPNVAAACLSVRAGAMGCGTIRATDVDGDALTFRLVEPPRHGTVAVELDGTFVYHPTARYVGSDHFTVRVSDGRGGSTDVDVPVAVTAPIKRVPDAALLCIGGVHHVIQSAPRSIDPSKIISCRASTPPHSDASTRLIIAGRPPQTASATRGAGAAGNGRHTEASGAGIHRNGLPLAAQPTHQSNLELVKSRINGPAIDGRDAATSARTSFFTRLSALAGRPNSGFGPIEKATKL